MQTEFSHSPKTPKGYTYLFRNPSCDKKRLVIGIDPGECNLGMCCAGVTTTNQLRIMRIDSFRTIAAKGKDLVDNSVNNLRLCLDKYDKYIKYTNIIVIEKQIGPNASARVVEGTIKGYFLGRYGDSCPNLMTVPPVYKGKYLNSPVKGPKLKKWCVDIGRVILTVHGIRYQKYEAHVLSMNSKLDDCYDSLLMIICVFMLILSMNLPEYILDKQY